MTELLVNLALLTVGVPVGWAAVVVVLRIGQMAWWRRSLVGFEIRLPRDVKPEQVAAWVGMLAAVMRARRWWSVIPRWPVGIETIATSWGIRRMLIVPARLRGDVLATVTAAIPGARLDEHTLDERDRPTFGAAAAARVVGAGELLATGRAGRASRHLLAALQPLEPGEQVHLRWLLAAAWSPRVLLRADINPNAVTAVLGAQWAQPEPVLLAACRVGVVTHLGRRRAHTVYGRVWAALRGLNTARARVVRQWRPRIVVGRQLWRRAVPVRRWPMCLTASEAAGLMGFTTGADTLPGIPAGVARSIPPSPVMPTRGLVLAASNYPGAHKPLCIRSEDRLRHTWIIGPTGAGKSTLLANLITYDINSGDGLVAIDARGDLIADVLDRIPPHRHPDVIVIDPTTTDHVIGINPLASGPPEQAASFVFHVLHSIYAASWGPRTADILRAALLTLACARTKDGKRYTLIELPELLTNPDFRRTVTAQTVSPQLAAFWRWYDALSQPQRLNAISPVLNKLRAFTLSTPLRLLLGQSDGVDLHEAIANNKIVLVPLKKGLLGAETAALVGSLVISSVWQATLRRIDIPADKRRASWLYVDEFQDTVRLPIDLADMLAQARGLGLGLTLAHQYLGQLTPDIKAAVLSTARTQVAFQLSHHDGKELASSFAPLAADDLRHLGAYEVAVRPSVGGATLAPVTGATYPLPPPVVDGMQLARESRQRWGLPAADIDAAIAARIATATVGKRANRIPVPESAS